MFDTICHEHLEYYSTKVILDLCKKNGLVVFDIKKNNINGSSKQYYVCRESPDYEINNKVIRSELNVEKKLKLTEVKTFKIFIKEINSSRDDLVRLLKKINKSGKKVHCYGASTKGNVLLQYFNIDN